MNADSVSGMKTKVLVDEFARLAQEVRTVFTLTSLPPPTPEREAAKRSLETIAAELRKRRPIANIRALFDHENKDVRAFAAGKFRSIDEDWASAAFCSMNEDMKTSQIVAMCALARRSPPRRPTLAEMTVEQLAARFEEAGLRRYATRFCGDGRSPFDVELSNKIADEIADITVELHARDATNVLVPLLRHSNVAVRRAAARACMSTAPDVALPVLEAIAAGTDEIEKSDAADSIRFWRGKRHGSAP